MAIQGMNLPSIAGVLGFKDFTNQLNNANAGVRNAVGLVNDWAKMAVQNNQAEKQAQAQRDFTAEQNQINRDFQQAQQNERFEHELGMFDKQQERQLKNDARKFRTSLYDFDNIKLTDKTDDNDLNELKIRNKVQEIKDHPEYFGSDEEYMNTITNLTRKADEIMIGNNELKKSNTIDSQFKELRDGDYRNAQQLKDWKNDNIDYIKTYKPELLPEINNALERKQEEETEADFKMKMLLNSMRNSNIGVRSNIRKEKKEQNQMTQEEKEDALIKALQQ